MDVTVFYSLVAFALLMGGLVYIRVIPSYLGGLAGMLLWLLVAYGSFNIEKSTFCCEVAQSEPVFAFVALGFAIAYLFVAFVGIDYVVPREIGGEL